LILVDTSVWVDHFRRGDSGLAGLLTHGLVVCHPFVVGELACGNLSQRDTTLSLLQDLPMSVMAEDGEARSFIERQLLYGKGLGYIDVHLLVSTKLTAGAQLWTRDRRLNAAANDLGCAYLGAGRH